MVDPVLNTRTWLLAQSTVTSLLGTNDAGSVYGGDLPPNFDPNKGAGIQVTLVGGLGHEEITQIVNARVQVKVWDNIGRQLHARQVAAAVYDLVHGATKVDFAAAGRLISAQAQDLGQDVTDPDTGWVTVVMAFMTEWIDTGSGLSDETYDQQGMDDNL